MMLSGCTLAGRGEPEEVVPYLDFVGQNYTLDPAQINGLASHTSSLPLLPLLLHECHLSIPLLLHLNR